MFGLDVRHVYQDEYYGWSYGDSSSSTRDHGLLITKMKDDKGFLATMTIKGKYFSGKGLTKADALSNMDNDIARHLKENWWFLSVQRNPLKRILLALL